MTTQRRCAQCGVEIANDAMGDLCHKCLLKAGLDALNPGELHIHCPHCRQAVEVLNDAPLAEMTCPLCDSKFSLIDELTLDYDGSGPKKFGRFDLLETLGVGAFGTVWKGRDSQLDRTVAVKIPRKGRLSAEECELFLREARTAAQLKHSNIVHVHEVGRQDEQLYIVSDYVEGLTLSDWLSGCRPAPREAAELTAKIARALHYAHEKGVIHRDLKPSNIIIDSAGEPHIMDFGLAKREAGEITMTVEGKVLGTPAYMSPEQAQGQAHHADRRSDIYSLGVILFELLTGEKPFRGGVRMLLHQVIYEEAPSPKSLEAHVPKDLETICLKCLEKQPDRRYNSSQELANELDRYMAGEPILARPISLPHRFWRWYQRRVTTIAAAYTIFTFMLLGVMVVILVMVIPFFVTVEIPGPKEALPVIGLLVFELAIAYFGVQCGVWALRGQRRGLWISLICFAIYGATALWGLFWSISVARNMSSEPLSPVFQPATMDAADPYIRYSVIGYGVLGAIWFLIGLALQVHAVCRRETSEKLDVGA